MNIKNRLAQENFHEFICPDIRAYWQLAKGRDSNQVVLKSTVENRHFQFSEIEGYALQYFTGKSTVAQVQNCLKQRFPDTESNLVVELLQKLISVGILGAEEGNGERKKDQFPSPRLKSCVQWIRHPEGYWILRNPEDVKFLQVSDRHKAAIERLGQLPPDIIAQEYNINREELRYLLQLLTATAMFEGTKPPKPPKRKFTPLQLLSFKFSLFNPDPWLTRHVDKLRWIWTTPFSILLCFFLAFSAVVSSSQSSEIVFTGQQMWATQGSSLMIAFGLLMMLVVSIHELGHAFTLKHYGGIVPEIGLMFMCLMPGCYTNTTDSYCLVKRRQRVLVVAAGVLCQLVIWAVALWLWNFSNPDTWLHTSSYLLMVAALFTVAVNLNPMSKFDGYYLAVAMSGINNLRSRSFQFYSNLLQRQPIQETPRNAWILAAYAPFSLAYTLLVFGHLWLLLSDWTLSHIPMTALTLLMLWAIYFYSPTPNRQISNNPKSPIKNPKSHMTATNSNSSNSPRSLQVVPSTKPQPTAPSIDTTKDDSTQTAPVLASPSNSKWLVVGAIAIGLCGLGLLPISQSVSGEAEIASTQGARQTVTMPVSGRIKEMLVNSNKQVEPNQAIAILISDDLDKDISKASIEFEQSQSSVAFAQQQIAPLQAQFNEALIKVEASNQKTEFIQQQLAQIKQGTPPPQVQELLFQQDGLRSEIIRLQSELDLLKGRENRYQEAVQAAVIPKNEIEDLQRQKNALVRQIDDKNYQIKAKAAQIETIKQNLQQQLQAQQAEEAQTVAAVQSAMQQVKQAAADVEIRQQMAAKMAKELVKQQDRQKELLLRSHTAGTVVTQNLDQLQNQYLPAGSKVLEVVDLRQLTVNVQIRPEDAPLVKTGASVTFRPQGTGLVSYTGTVMQGVNIDPVVSEDEMKRSPAVTVRVLLSQGDNLLRPGLKGYAHIEGSSVRLYQKLQREFVKLVPVGKFF